MLKVLICGKPGRGFSALDALADEGGYSRSSAPRGLQKALMRQGIVDDPVELSDLARRYLFLGDAQMLLAESRNRPTPISHSFEFARQLSTERPTQSETGVRYQCP